MVEILDDGYKIDAKQIYQLMMMYLQIVNTLQEVKLGLEKVILDSLDLSEMCS